MIEWDDENNSNIEKGMRENTIFAVFLYVFFFFIQLSC